MHIVVLCDMEGACGIAKKRQCHTGHNAWWSEGRPALTADVIAACHAVLATAPRDGKLELREMHDSGCNVLGEQLPSEVIYRPGIQMNSVPLLGNLDGIDGFLLLAQHDTAAEAFFPHCFHGRNEAVLLNEREVNEPILLALALAERGIPVLTVSGDAPTIDRFASYFPGIPAVIAGKDPQAEPAAVLANRTAFQNSIAAGIAHPLIAANQGLHAPYEVCIKVREGYSASVRGWPLRKNGRSLYGSAKTAGEAIALIFGSAYLPHWALSLLPAVVKARNVWARMKYCR